VEQSIFDDVIEAPQPVDAGARAEDVITYGSACSGIEAATLAWHPLGWRAEWFAEIEPFPSAVLAYRWPNVPNLGDMTRIAGKVLARRVAAPTVLVAGTPCQSFSVAGLRDSMSDARGQLTIALVRLADAIDHVRNDDGLEPCIVVWENVTGVLNTPDNAFGCFLAALVGESEPLIATGGGAWPDAGAVYGPTRSAAWRVLDAQHFGLAQRRRRVFVVASARAGGFDPCAVLFEPASVLGDSAPSGEAGEGVASALTASVGGCDVDDAQGGRLIAGTVSAKWAKGTGGPSGDECQNLVAFTCKDAGGDAGELAPSLRAMNHRDGNANGGGQVAIAHAPIAFDPTQITHPENRSNPQPDGPCHALARGQQPPAVAFNIYPAGGQGADLEASPTDVANAVSPVQNGASTDRGTRVVQHGVRRLTPRECERLQGMPDDYTLVPWRTWQESVRALGAAKGCSFESILAARGFLLREPAGDECPDSPRYRAIGNSKPVDVVRWIGRRIDALVRYLRAQVPA
jgi:DNA (cytosine-5)-methyltransferase 1